MRWKYVIRGILALSLILACGVAKVDKVMAQEKLRIGTGPQGGTYYSIGAGMAEILNKWGGFKATAQATGGGIQNSRLIESREIDMATVSGQPALMAYRGEKPFTKKIDLRIGFFMYEDPAQLVVLAGSPIKSFYDLRGKKVAVGAMGSGVEAHSKVFLEAHGLRYSDLVPRHIGASDATEALKDGVVDAAYLWGALPTAAITELSLLNDMRILSMDDTIMQKIIKDHPYLTVLTIPANTYKNQRNDIKVLAERSFILFSPDMKEDVAYKVVKTIFQHLDHLATIHKAAERFSVVKACEFDIGLPYHPGALKYFREVGAIKK
jgi:TRAP transporter TAXI family solute receptor